MTTSMVGLKNQSYVKISSKMMKPGDIAVKAEEVYPLPWPDLSQRRLQCCIWCAAWLDRGGGGLEELSREGKPKVPQ